MKKLKTKIRSLVPGGAKKTATTEAVVPERITNETVAEHRERILAGGRKFKYPMQHPKHHIVLTTLGIVLAVLVAVGGITAWQLYRAQNTSGFAYSATSIVPFPVARADGSLVRYSDYLSELRSALHYLSTKENINFNTDDGKRLKEYQKRLALTKTEQGAYIKKIARQQGIAVTNKEVNEFVNSEITNNDLGVNEQVYRQVIRDYYGWSLGDYKRSVKAQLLRKKVVARIDTAGRNAGNEILTAVKGGADFAELAKQRSSDPQAQATGGDAGVIPKSSDDPDGLITAAEKLQPGQVSDLIEGADGFYIVKLVDQAQDTIHFAKIFIAYTEFDKQFAQLKKDGKITEYIDVAETVTSTSR